MSIRVKLIIICQTLSILYASPQFSQQLSEVGIIIHSILQMRKLKSKMVHLSKECGRNGRQLGTRAYICTFLLGYLCWKISNQ